MKHLDISKTAAKKNEADWPECIVDFSLAITWNFAILYQERKYTVEFQ